MRKWLMPCLALLLQGCQPPPPFVIAAVEGGKLIFHIRQRGILMNRIFGWDDQYQQFSRLTIIEGNSAVVRFEEGNGATTPCLSSETFPVTLGERRCGYRWVGRGELPSGDHLYEVYLDSCVGLPAGCEDIGDHWADHPVGRFRLNRDGSITNIRPD